MNYKKLTKLIEKDGWIHVRTNGTHKHYRHPIKKGTVTIAGHKKTDEVPIGTEISILKQAGLK
ncbi:type II toxin-antitoxin system HicA family toxin [Pseudolactococcus yaeyamensis]